MGSCITSQWAGSTCPQARLTVSYDAYNSSDTIAVYNWTLDYVAHGYAASTGSTRGWSVQVGNEVVHGSFNINGVSTTTTIRTGTVRVTRSTVDTTMQCMVGFDFSLTWSGVYGGVKSATMTETVLAKPSYVVAYNANGGTGAPSNQTKMYDVTLTLSSTHPTRTGYTFQGWSTSWNGGVAYYAGGAYTANANVTLYAIWELITYPILFNANGGTGGPSSQTKYYGTILTLPNTIPTRVNYDFLGWATSASATTATYSPGGPYTVDAGATLYAVWKLAYKRPAIFNLFVTRCDSFGNANDSGEYAQVSFEWSTFYADPTINVEVRNEPTISVNTTGVGTAGTFNNILGTFSTEKTYSIAVSVTDIYGSSSATSTLSSTLFTIDLLAGGRGIAFGKAAELENTADFAFTAKFNKPVYGKALGMDWLPEIPAGSDLNDYIDPGCWAIYTNLKARQVTSGGIPLGSANVPPDGAGRLEVWSSTGEGVYSKDYSYLRQRYITYNSPHAVWERDITRNTDNVWTYGEWWRSSLNPDASNKVYHEQKILWGPDAWHMGGEHTITLSEPVSKQPNGIVLVFSRYVSETVYDYNFNTFFVPKTQILNYAQNSNGKGAGHTFIMTTDAMFDFMAAKYLYLSNETISGHNNNRNIGVSGSGIKIDNAQFVLRYVIGV